MDKKSKGASRKRKLDDMIEEHDAPDQNPKKQKVTQEVNDEKYKLPNLSEASIRMQSLESEFFSGRDLFEKGNKPRSVLAIKNRLQADFEFFKSILIVSPDGRIIGTQCDCSKESSYQWCAHVIATILFVSNRAASVIHYDKLKEKINSLSIEELRNGLLNSIFAHPSALHVEVDCIFKEPAFLSAELSDDIDKTSKTKKSQSIAGIEDIINKIKIDLKQAARKYDQSRVFESSDDSYDSPELGEGEFTFIRSAVEPYLIRIANLYHQGEIQAAVEVGIALTDELIGLASDSEIHITNGTQYLELLLRIEATWIRLITYWTYQRDIEKSPEAEVNPELARKLTQKIVDWMRHAEDNFDDMFRTSLPFSDCTTALTSGWQDDTLKHILIGDIPLTVPRANHENNNNLSHDEESEEDMQPIYLEKEALEVTEARIDALCLLGKTKEAVNLSTASGQHFKAAELLLAHGKTEQAVSEALRHVIEPANALKFAKSIREQDPTGAFCVAVIGLKTRTAIPVALQAYMYEDLMLNLRGNITELGRWTLDFILTFAKKKKSELGRQKTSLAVDGDRMDVNKSSVIVIDDEGPSKDAQVNTILSLADLASQSCVTVLAEQEMGSVKRVLDSVPPEIQERLMLDIIVELSAKDENADMGYFMLGQVETLLDKKLTVHALRILIASTKSQFANVSRAIDVASKLGPSYLVDTVSKCLKNIANVRRIESEDAFSMATNLLEKGFPREGIAMAFVALTRTNTWQSAMKKDIVQWIFQHAAAADCWHLIEEKMPSILTDLSNDSTLLLELAKQCEKDGKQRFAIKLAMGALRREPEETNPHRMYDHDQHGYYSHNAAAANQSAIAWLLPLIMHAKEKAKLLKDLATKVTEVLSSTSLFKLAKEFHDMKEDAMAINLGTSAASKAHSNSSTSRLEVFIWCVKLALGLPQSKEIDDAIERGLPLIDNGKDALQLADIIYKGERDELALQFAMRALATIKNSHQATGAHTAYWLMSRPITEDYYTPLTDEKEKLVAEALTFIAKIGKKLKLLEEVAKQNLKSINNSDVLWAFAKMLMDENVKQMALEYGQQAIKEIHSTKSGLLLWVCKLANSLNDLIPTLNAIKPSLRNFDELYELSKFCLSHALADQALAFALDSLKYITSLPAETREEVLDYVVELALKKQHYEFELNIKKIASQLKLSKDVLHVAKLCINNKFPELGLDVALTIFRRDRTFDKSDLLWLCEQSWKLAKDDGITRVIERCLANSSAIINIITLAYFVHDTVKDKLRALELGEKALVLVPEAMPSHPIGHRPYREMTAHERLLHHRNLLHRHYDDDSSDSDDGPTMMMDIDSADVMELEEDLNGPPAVPRRVTFGDVSDDPKFLSKFCTWLCDLAHNFGQDRFRTTIDKCCEVLQRSQDNFEFARYVKVKGDVLKAAKIMKGALNKTPPINITERRDYAKELYSIYWENADVLSSEPLPEMENYVAYISSCNELLDFADWVLNLGTPNGAANNNNNNNNTNVEVAAPAKKKRGPKPKKQPIEKMIVEEPLAVGNPRMDTIKDALFIGRRALDIPSTADLKHKASKWLLEKARLVKDTATEKKALAALFTTEPSLELLLELKATTDPAFWPEERRNLLAKVPEHHPVHIEIKFSDGQVEEALNSLTFAEQTLYNTNEANQKIAAVEKAIELFAKNKKLHKKEFIDKVVSLLTNYVWRSWVPITVTNNYAFQSAEVAHDARLERALNLTSDLAPSQIKALLQVHKVLSKCRKLLVLPKKPSYLELAKVLGEVRPIFKKFDRMPEFNRTFELIKQTQGNRPVCIEILRNFEAQAKADDMQSQLNELKNIVE